MTHLPDEAPARLDRIVDSKAEGLEGPVDVETREVVMHEPFVGRDEAKAFLERINSTMVDPATEYLEWSEATLLREVRAESAAANAEAERLRAALIDVRGFLRGVARRPELGSGAQDLVDEIVILDRVLGGVATAREIKAIRDPASSGHTHVATKSWTAYVDGKCLVDTHGRPRRFSTESTALAAGRRKP